MTEVSVLEINVVSAVFLKDSDVFGKQDPFITFQQGEQFHRTKTAENAGTNAQFSEQFALSEIYRQLEADEDVTFQAFDEDVGGQTDFLGKTHPLPYRKLCLTGENA